MDEATGKRFPFDLTKNELQGMQIVGLPIKIEHHQKGFEKGDEVGKVTRVFIDPDTGYTACKFDLFETIPGRVAARMINATAIGSLSLGHVVSRETGKVTAKEVSVCFEGARKGTHLYKKHTDFDDHIAAAEIKVAASMDSTPAATTPAEAAAPTATPGDDVATMDLTSLLERVCANQPTEVSSKLFDEMSRVAERVDKGAKEREAMQLNITHLQGENAQLQSASVELKAQQDMKTKQAVATFQSLMAEYVSSDYNMKCGESDADQAAHVLSQIPVLASALHRAKEITESRGAHEMAVKMQAMRDNLRPRLWEEARDEPVRKAPKMNDDIAVNASGRAAEPVSRTGNRLIAMGLSDVQRKMVDSLGDSDDKHMNPSDFYI